MNPKKSSSRSRNLISGSPTKRPYGAGIGFLLSNSNRFGFEGESCLLVKDDVVVRLSPGVRKEGEFEVQDFSAAVEGFATAGEAEQAGLKLSLSILWASVSMECPLRLQYHTPLPSIVYDRTRSRGPTMFGTAHSVFTTPAPTIVDIIDQVFSSNTPVNPRLLVSMELFAGARLETTERARFIGLVSALEPLAQQKSLGPDIKRFIKETMNALGNCSGINEELYPSLKGRLNELVRESVTQAILRLARAHLQADRDAIKKVKEAYSIRSRILHEGSTDADLNQKSAEIQGIIRRIYASMIRRDLRK